MALDRFFRRRRPQQQPGADVPDLWTQCPACKEGVYNRDLEAGAYVCPKCGHHIRLDAAQRAALAPSLNRHAHAAGEDPELSFTAAEVPGLAAE